MIWVDIIVWIFNLSAIYILMNLTRIHDSLCMVFSKIDEKL